MADNKTWKKRKNELAKLGSIKYSPKTRIPKKALKEVEQDSGIKLKG